MNRKMRFSGGVGLLWLAALAPSSHAEAGLQEYIFEVPVTISNADPRLVKGSVTCSVEGPVVGAYGRGGQSMPPFHSVEGSESFLLKGGAYQGRVPVRLSTAFELRQPSYSCRLGLYTADGKNAVECIIQGAQKLTQCHAAAWSNLDSENLVGSTSAPVPQVPARGMRDVRGAPETPNRAGVRPKRDD